MLEFVQHPAYGQIVYEESIWTGKKTIKINGVAAQPVSKKEFTVDEKNITVNGSFLTGVRLLIDDETIEVSPKPQWYEILLSIIPFVFLIIWGNNSALYTIFPVIGGGIGGGLGGFSVVISLLLMKNSKKPIKKVLIGLGVFVATVMIAFLLALAIDFWYLA